MSNLVCINNKNISIKEYKGKRVVTFKEIDELHNRPEGTARQTFNRNKNKFIEEEDYFVCKTYEAAQLGFTAPNGMNLITESGYLMLTKPFTDDLSWEVQKKLVNSYFRLKEIAQVPQYKLPQNYKEALLQLVDQVEENEKLQAKVLYLAPKAESYDTLMNATGNLTIQDAAKNLNIKDVGQKNLFKILVKENILIKHSYFDRSINKEVSHYEAYQQYVNSGYFIHKQNPLTIKGEVIKRTQVFVTPKGLDWLAKTLRRLGYMEVA